MNNINQLVAQIKQNPGVILGRRFGNIPPNMTNSGDIIQYLLDAGRITQGQLNNANMQARNNPLFQMFRR